MRRLWGALPRASQEGMDQTQQIAVVWLLTGLTGDDLRTIEVLSTANREAVNQLARTLHAREKG